MAGRRTSGYQSYGPPVPSDEAPGSAPESAIAVHTLTSAAKDLIEGAFPPLWVRGEVSDFKAHRNGHWYFALRDAEALERTRLSLEKDGLLDPSRKRALPAFPRRIAVITSPDGAAMHDIITVARARSADVEIVIVAAKVQGEGAPESLVSAIERVSRWQDADVLIIGRGGGAREDLWAFNDERVARALAACPMPTISAVGHEVDVTICDLVADVRAATPSAAAELAVPSRREVIARVESLGSRLVAAARRREDRAIASLSQVQKRLGLAATRIVERRRSRVESLAGQLHALSPLSTLARGFAVARTPEGATLSGRDQFVPGAPFDLWLRDGIVSAIAGEGRPLPESIPGFPSEEGV